MDDELNPSRAEESGYDARFRFRTSLGSKSRAVQGAKKASLENDWEGGQTMRSLQRRQDGKKKRKRGRRGGRGAWTL